MQHPIEKEGKVGGSAKLHAGAHSLPCASAASRMGPTFFGWAGVFITDVFRYRLVHPSIHSLVTHARDPRPIQPPLI
jgi:hypothetical protein